MPIPLVLQLAVRIGAGPRDPESQATAPFFGVYNTISVYTPEFATRTNIVIDDTLMKEALKASGAKTKREAVELGLQTLVRLNRQAAIKRFRGKLAWEGNLRESRTLRR